MGGLETLVNLLGISFVSGINLYATVLVVGLGQYFGLLGGLPEELHVLAHPAVMIAAGALYLLEFVADKVPGVSIVWDGIHTFIRPLGATLLALGVTADLDPVARTLAALAAGSIALGTHSAKAGFRLVAHTAPEPASFSLISLAEDLGVVGILALAFTYPWVALGILIALIIGMLLVLPVLFRAVRFVLACAAGGVRGWLGDASSGPAVPPWLDEALTEQGAGANCQVYRAYASGVGGLPRFAPGYLVVSAPQAFFVCRRFGCRTLPLAPPPSGDLPFSRRVLCDVVIAKTLEGQVVRLCLPKDQSARLRLAGGPDISPGGQPTPMTANGS